MRSMIVLLAVCVSAQAQVPSLINYQGRLVNDTNLVNETVGLSLQLYDDPAAGTLLYEDSNQVAVVDGLYSTFIGDDTVSGTLTGALASAEVWIQVLVNGAPLTPREQLVSAAYALRAGDVPGNAFWRTEGNDGTTAGTHFVGTTDEQPLHLRANNATVLRLDGEPNPPNLIGGHASNYADPGVNGAFIGGGGDPTGSSPNRVSDHHGVVGGGIYNIAGDGGGGVSNSSYATVAGGANNSAASEHSFIGGGLLNQIFGWSAGAVIAGGYNNIARGTNSTVGGGGLNEARAEGATIAGGANNYTASRYAAIGGGLQNNADGTNAVVPGGYLNKAKGVNSFAAGQMAEALHGGAFVWADNSISVSFASTASNQFILRAAGGVGINTNGPFTDALTVNGNVRATGVVRAVSFAGDGSNLTSLDGNSLVPGSVETAALDADAVTSEKILDSTITANDVAPNTFWSTEGNAGTEGGDFLGTTDTQPLQLGVNNQRVARYEGGGTVPNVIGGHVANTATYDVVGATIAGGGDGSGSFPQRVTDNYGTVGGGFGNRAGNSGGGPADAAFSTVAGGLKNVANALNSTIGGGEMNAVGTAAQGGVIGGGTSNIVVAGSSTVGGGRRNEIRVDAFNATIGGGTFNLIETNAQQSVIGGGRLNAIWRGAYYATIGGGVSNHVGAVGATIAGGGFTADGVLGNTANGGASFIGGGAANLAEGILSVVAGGFSNAAIGTGAAVGGGLRNTAESAGAVIAGGSSNSVLGQHGSIGGGSLNAIGLNAEYAAVAGGRGNTVNDGFPGAFIGGGQGNVAGGTNAVVAGGQDNLSAGAFSTVAGGRYNTANSTGSFIGGGTNNSIGSGASYSIIVGGRNHSIQQVSSFIGGGYGHTVLSDHSSVGSGYQNYIGSLANFSVIAGGEGNVMTNAPYAHGSFIGGGYYNSVSSRWAVVAGGYRNFMGGEYAVIGGGSSNVVNGDYAVVPGGRQNVAEAPYSFAAGRKASAVHTGAFVWADSAGAVFSSTTNDQFAIQATNGVWIAQDRGTNAVPFGTRFRDNSVVAWAKVSDAGVLTESFNVHTVTNAAVGRYDILLKTGAGDFSALIPVANAEIDGQPSGAADVRLVSVDQLYTNRFKVYINDGTFAPVNDEFTVVVFGR